MAKKGPPKKRVNVKFFRAIRASKEAPGWEWPADGDVASALVEAFKARDEAGFDGWQQVQYWGRTFLVELHQEKGAIQFGVSTVRSDDLPLVLPKNGRTGTPLPLAAGENLLEPSYLTFFANRVVGFVGGQHTPGHRMCAAALARVTRINVALAPIPRTDILLALQRGDGLASLDLTIAAGSLDAAAETEDVVRSAAELVARVAPAQTLKITLGAETEQQKRGLRNLAVRLVKRRGISDLKGAHAYVLSQEHGSGQLDLLEAQITHRQVVEVDDRTRHLMPAPAQEAASAAFGAVDVELSHAIALADDDLDAPPLHRADGADEPEDLGDGAPVGDPA